MGKREPQIIPQKRRARHSPRAWVRGEFTAKSSGWDENRVFLEGDKLEVAAHAPARGPATGGRTAPMLFSGRLKRRCNGVRLNDVAVTIAFTPGESPAVLKEIVGVMRLPGIGFT
jgi:hypothetical protein